MFQKQNKSITYGNSAIVIGGSIAGLVAAKILSDYFQEVTIVEGDRFSTDPEFRRGVPQSNHPHMLLSKGLEVLESFFPGLSQELFDNNSQSVNVTRDFAFLLCENNWTPRFCSDMVSIGCSRNLLELIIRNRVKQLERVKILEQHRVIKLLSDRDKSVITGVQIKNREGSILELKANLVVDASGRNSQTPQWLESLGYQKPKTIEVDCNIAYATRVYRRPESFQEDWKGIFIRTEAPHRKKGGAIFPIENNCWMVTVSGREGDFPSTKETEFIDFARSLSTPAIYNAIQEAEPLSPIYGYKGLINSFKQYHLMEKFPENFIVLGDAVCTFNPVNGQGMTVAALEVLALAQGLSQQKDNLAGFSRKFQAELATIVKTPWTMATDQDLPWDKDRKATLIEKLKLRYFSLIQKAACRDREVWYTFAKVMNLSLPPTAFFSLKIISKVFRQIVLKFNFFLYAGTE